MTDRDAGYRAKLATQLRGAAGVRSSADALLMSMAADALDAAQPGYREGIEAAAKVAEVHADRGHHHYSAMKIAAAIRSLPLPSTPDDGLERDESRFRYLTNEGPAQMPEGYSAPLGVKTSYEMAMEYESGSTPDDGKAEAVAFCQPMDCGKHTPRKFMIYFDDPDHGIMVFEDEAEARATFAKKNTNWNCYLFGTLPLHPSPASDCAIREAIDALKSAERWLDWCVCEHYAPDSSQEQAALAQVRKSIKDLTAHAGGAAKESGGSPCCTLPSGECDLSVTTVSGPSDTHAEMKG